MYKVFFFTNLDKELEIEIYKDKQLIEIYYHDLDKNANIQLSFQQAKNLLTKVLDSIDNKD